MMFIVESLVLFVLTLPSIVSAVPQAPNAASTWKPAASNLIFAQQMVYDLLARHPDLRVVGIHGKVPSAANSTQGTIIAINMDRIGKLDDSDDDGVAFEHKIILAPNLKKATEYEITMPLLDAAGNVLNNSINFVFNYQENHAGDDTLGLFTRAYVYRQEAARMLISGRSIHDPVKTLNAQGSELDLYCRPNVK